MAFKHFWVQYKLGSISDQAYIKSESFVIGRAPECDLPIPTDILSRRHLEVILEEDKIFVKDLGSTNGTYLQGQQLKPNEPHEYVTGNRLYLDAGKECSLRITAIYQRDIVDIDLEQKGLELEKKKQQLRSKGKVNRQLKEQYSRENFVSNASESVDNIFENLIYVAKSVRFNKEKKIREAENISQEMIEQAQREIEDQRALLEKELKVLQVETKKEANRILKSANEKAAAHMKKVEAKARKIRQEASAIRATAQSETEAKHQEIVNQAQEKHGQIIAEAHLKNRELKEENSRIDSELKERRDQREAIELEVKSLKEKQRENRELVAQTKEAYEQEQSYLEMLKSKVEAMEKRNSEAVHVLEVEVPGLEKKIGVLKKGIIDSEIELKKKQTEIEVSEKLIQEKKKEEERNLNKATQSEKRLDELSAKIIEAEDHLFKLTKVKQDRTAEIEKEVAERRERQAESEKKSYERIAKKKERSEREIEVNLAKAKEMANEILSQAQKEVDADLEKAKSSAENVIESAKGEAEQILAQAKLSETELKSRVEREVESAQEEATKLRSEAKAYCDQTTQEADDYAQRTREEVDIEISSRRKNFELEVQEAKDKLLSDGRKEVLRMKSEAKEQAEALVAEAEKKAEQIVSDVRGKADLDLESLQKEIEDRKKATEEEIQSIRTHAVQKMEEQRQQFEKEEAERNRIRVLRLRKDLNEVLRARITPFLKDPAHVERVSQVVGKSINTILLDEVEDEVFDAENYSDIDPSLQQAQVKKFYMVGAGALFCFIFLFLSWSSIKQLAKDSGRSIATDLEKQDQAQIEKAQKENDLSAAFNPEMKVEFLDNYTDRVLYTKDYLKLENDPGFKAQWRIELEEFFVDTLRLTETDLVPFVAREAALIKELGEARKNINGNFVDQGRERMQQIEANFYKRLKEGGLKKEHFNQIRDFKKKFFEANKELFLG